MIVRRRVAITSLTLAACIGTSLWYTTPSSRSQASQIGTPDSCHGVEKLFWIAEPALTPAQVEAQLRSGDYVLGSKGPPANEEMIAEWRDFAKSIPPGDSIFAVTDSSYGGYAIIRGYCVVDEFAAWMS